jgi:hypothetical protein
VRLRRWTDHACLRRSEASASGRQAIDLPAPTDEDAVAHARSHFGQHRTAMFEHIDEGEEAWAAEDGRAVIEGEFPWLLREIEGGAS